MRIQVFRPGRHVALSGEVISFSEADLRATAEAYDPKIYEAPLVIGHPQIDDPAYGWTQSLSLNDGVLEAEPRQVDAAFAELVRAGRFKRVSGSFFKPDSPSNPKAGVYYLRHIGFLGAAAPAVQGLRPVAFGADEQGVIEFAWSEAQNASLWRQLRDWLIEKFGREEADKVIPDYAVTNLTESAARGDASMSPSYAAAPKAVQRKEEDDMKGLLKLLGLKEDATESEAIAALNTREASFTDRENKIRGAEAAQRRAGVSAFVETLVKDGKILPRRQAALVEFMASIDETSVIEFAEDANGGATRKTRGVDWLREFLAELPKQIDYSERSAAEDRAATSAQFAAPHGYSVDPVRLDLHRKALEYRAKNPTVSYAAAISAVSN